MKYDFDQILPRIGTDSIKWDYESRGGNLRLRHPGKDPLAEGELLPMWVADMDFPLPQPVLEAMQKRVEHGSFGYTQPSESYFDAIVNWMQRRKGWKIEKEWIMTTPKVIMTINLLVQALTKPEDKVIVQTPVFHPIYLGVENNGRKLVRNPLKYQLGKYTIDFDYLETKAADPAAKMLILCSPHNPVGRVWTRSELTRIAEICAENNLLLIVDEIHSDLVYGIHLMRGTWRTIPRFSCGL